MGARFSPFSLRNVDRERRGVFFDGGLFDAGGEVASSDGSFPHDDSSLGFKYERKVTWVRLQTLIEDPVYYSSESLASLTRFQCSNKALEMAICILADCQPNLLKNHMLHTLNFEGVYQYCFLKDGVIRNVIIDDYIPCYEKKPVFCNPYNFT